MCRCCYLCLQDYLYARAYISFAGAILASAPVGHQEVLLASLAALPADLAWFKDKAVERGLDLEHTGALHSSGNSSDELARSSPEYSTCVLLQYAMLRMQTVRLYALAQALKVSSRAGYVHCIDQISIAGPFLCKAYQTTVKRLSQCHKLRCAGSATFVPEPQPACREFADYLRELQSKPYPVQAAALWAIELSYYEAWAAVLRQQKTDKLKDFASRYGVALPSLCTRPVTTERLPVKELLSTTAVWPHACTGCAAQRPAVAGWCVAGVWGGAPAASKVAAMACRMP